MHFCVQNDVQQNTALYVTLDHKAKNIQKCIAVYGSNKLLICSYMTNIMFWINNVQYAKPFIQIHIQIPDLIAVSQPNIDLT